MPTANTSVARVIYVWCREDGSSVFLGEAGPFSSKTAGAVFHLTKDRATAKLWAQELAAGRAPGIVEDRLSSNP